MSHKLILDIFSQGPIGKTIFLAFMNVIFGFIFGIVAGLLMWVFPDPRQVIEIDSKANISIVFKLKFS